MRATIPYSLTIVLLCAACGDEGSPPAADNGGSSSAAGTQNVPAAGSTSTGTGGSPTVSGGSAPSYGTYGGGDNGGLFGPNAVPFDPSAQGGSGGTGVPTGGSGGTGPSGDGNVATGTFRRGLSGTVTFTQTGIDVTAVVDITGGCPGGDVLISVHDGYSCDNAETEGVPWGERAEMGTVTCDGSSASATFTREGSDPNTNWTVADHNLDTDVTGHVLIVTPVGDSADRIACANFF